MGFHFDELSDLFRASRAPFSASGGTRRFELDTSDDSITPAAGVHVVYNAGPSLAWVRLGSAVAALVDKDAETAGQFPIPVGGSITLACNGSAALHGLVAADTASLYLSRLVAL